MRIDLNCDMGESFGTYTLGLDEQVMPLISSANIACGFHAGDPQVMRRSVRLAAQYGVGVGAHVSFPDLVGFGRREMRVTPAELENDLLYQMGAIAAFCQAEGAVLRHVKPHGALYNMVQRDTPLAQATARAVRIFDASLLLFAQPGSDMEQIGIAQGLTVVGEVFADRAYTPTGLLVNRSQPGAVLHDPEAVAERSLQMAVTGRVTAIDGSELPIRAETICVHGDTPGAVDLIGRIRDRLIAADVSIQPATKRNTM